MHIFSVLLDGFYAATAPSSGGGPLVVARERKVLDACPEARARGILPGMPLSEARSVLAEDGTIVRWEEDAYREPARRWLDVVARYSDVVEPLSQHEALADLSGHPRPREAAESLERALRAAGLAPRCGLAPCRWMARLAARRGDPFGLALADPRSYVSGIPAASLPVAPEIARSLGLLGCRTAADVAGIPEGALREQFGEAAHLIAQSAIGRGNATVCARYPEGAAAARHVFEAPPETTQELEAGLLVLARQVGTDLRERDAAGRGVELFLEHEGGDVTRLARTFARSIADERDVRAALRLMLPTAPPRRVESVRARLPELRQTRRVQLDVHGGRSRLDREESVWAAVHGVRTAYGDSAVRLGSEIPEPRWVRVRRAYRQLNGWAWA